MNKRTTYNLEFKTNAVQLALTNGKAMQTTAKDLGIGFSFLDKCSTRMGLVRTLQRWVAEQRGTNGTPTSQGQGVQHALELENRRLRRELEIVRQEREIVLTPRRTCLDLKAAPYGPGR